MKSATASLWLAALCCMASSPLWAQARYTCRDESGATYQLSRPCPAGMRTTAVSAGPVDDGSRYSSSGSSPSYRPPAQVSEGPAYQRYMGARCRSLSDGIRSASARGTSYEVLAGMRREYRRDCREEEREASIRYYEDRSDTRRQQREEDRQVQLAVQASRDEENRRAQQCAESRRILQSKQARTDLTPGERNDLRRFEEAFASRCAR